jgi:hypothetical protein
VEEAAEDLAAVEVSAVFPAVVAHSAVAAPAVDGNSEYFVFLLSRKFDIFIDV